MKDFLSKSVVRKMNLMVLVAITLGLVGFGMGIGYYNYTRTIQDLTSTASNTIELATVALREPLWSFDEDIAQTIVDAMMLDENVARIQVFTENKEKPTLFSVAESFKDVDFSGLSADQADVIHKSSDITRGKEYVATIEIAITTLKARDFIRNTTIAIGLLVLGLIVVLTTILTISANRSIKRPLNQLEQSADLLGHGDLDAEIDVSRSDEIGRLAVSFVNMREAIRLKIRELEQLNETLDARVQERTKKLSVAYENLKEAQASLIQSEKMASLGQMVAGVAHEVNTPLAYVKNNVEAFADVLGQVKEYVHESGQLLQILEEADTPQRDLSEQKELVSNLADESLDAEFLQECDDLVRDSVNGLEQISELVTSLKDFSRMDRAKMDNFNLNDGINSTLRIINSLLKSNIIVEKNFGEIPPISCSPSQINQVFLNILTNSVQAMEGKKKGLIRITTRVRKNNVEVIIQDNGKGIPDNVLPKIQDPFFTTKPVGQGTGLGLTISRQIIVQQHGGKLHHKSVVGVGTATLIALPLTPTTDMPPNEADLVTA